MAKADRSAVYKPEYSRMMVEYFQKEPFTTLYKREYYQDGQLKSETPILTAAEFPTLQAFANSLDVDMATLQRWKEAHPAFSAAYARAKELQERLILVNGMQGLYNIQFAQFYSKNKLGYDKQQETPQIIIKLDTSGKA